MEFIARLFSILSPTARTKKHREATHELAALKHRRMLRSRPATVPEHDFAPTVALRSDYAPLTKEHSDPNLDPNKPLDYVMPTHRSTVATESVSIAKPVEPDFPKTVQAALQFEDSDIRTPFGHSTILPNE